MSLIMHFPTADGLVICADKRHGQLLGPHQDDHVKLVQLDDEWLFALAGTVAFGGSGLTPLLGFRTGLAPSADFAVAQSVARFLRLNTPPADGVEIPGTLTDDPFAPIRPRGDYVGQLLSAVRDDLSGYLRSDPPERRWLTLANRRLFSIALYGKDRNGDRFALAATMLVRRDGSHSFPSPRLEWQTERALERAVVAIGNVGVFCEVLQGDGAHESANVALSTLQRHLAGLALRKDGDMAMFESDTKTDRLRAPVVVAGLQAICSITHDRNPTGAVSRECDWVLMPHRKTAV